jgi:hypothetical protein
MVSKDAKNLLHDLNNLSHLNFHTDEDDASAELVNYWIYFVFYKLYRVERPATL